MTRRRGKLLLQVYAVDAETRVRVAADAVEAPPGSWGAVLAQVAEDLAREFARQGYGPAPRVLDRIARGYRAQLQGGLRRTGRVVH